MGYQETVRMELEGLADVWGPDANCEDSKHVRAHLNQWALSQTADVIHVNCGLHDLKREFGASKNQVPPDKYEDTVREMRDDGRARVLTVVTAAYSSWSSCRAYWRDIERAREAVPGAPVIERVRTYFNHPGFVAACVERVREGLAQLGDDAPAATVLFSAHSIPRGMAAGCDFVRHY